MGQGLLLIYVKCWRVSSMEVFDWELEGVRGGGIGG